MTEVQLFKPYPKQREFINSFIDSEHLFGVAVAPRGSGKSLMGMNIMLFWLLDNKNQKGAWISPVYNQARNVYDQIIQASGELVIQSNRQDLAITFINNSTLKFLSADNPDSIRGFRFNYVIIDEAAFVKDLTIQQNILPTLNPNGKKCLMISTPRGKNHLFEWFNKPEVLSMRFPLTECPYVKSELIEEARRSLPVDIFRQEYEAAFVDSANDVFQGVDKVSNVGRWSTDHKVDVYVGIDTGLTSDMSVITCISPMGRVLYMEGTNNESIQSIATKFISIMDKYNVVGGYVEVNGIGRAMYDLLAPKFRKLKDFSTTQNNKTDMVRKLLRDIETYAIELPSDELCPELHQEFTTYTYKISQNGNMSFGHMPGKHDDYVDSLLMANYSRNQFMERKPMTVSSIKPVNLKPSFGGPR